MNSGTAGALGAASREGIGPRAILSFLGKVVIYLLLSATALSMLVPFLWMVFTAFKPDSEIFNMPPVVFTTSYTLAHYGKALINGHFDVYFRNSAIVSGSATILNVLISAMAGYAFARLKWRGREAVFMIVLAVMMLPGLIALIPTFLIVRSTPFAGGNDWLGQGGTGWLDSYPGLIFPMLGSGFYVFLLRQFFLTLPKELEDAARIDGSSEFGIFHRIILPLSKPVLAVVSIFGFQSSWNEFLWPLVIIQSDDMRTVQLGLSLFRSQTRVDWGQLMAGTTLATIPTVVVFLLAQQYFVRGIALTGIKG